MKNVVIWFFAFALGFIGVGLYGYIRTSSAANPVISKTTSVPIPAPTYALNPPSEALSGMIVTETGTVKKLSRNETDYTEASAGAQILLGESIATDADSTTVASVSGMVTAYVDASSELVFANMFPSNFVLQQKNGRVTYDVYQPIAVRALHSLISLNSGTYMIHIIDTDMSVTAISGSAKLAIVDTDNNTHVYDIGEGERLNIDDANRLVYRVRTHY